MKTIALSIALLLISANVYAYCDNYPDISVAEEVKASEFVVVGTVIGRMIIVDPDEDPEGYEAEIFKFRIEEVISGKPKPEISLYNVNTSARFPMEKGQKYLLFVRSGEDGYWVDSCGNSDEYRDSAKLLNEVKKLVQEKMHNEEDSPDLKAVR